jgi:dolichyl-phosphate beta-glucosyltransferase
MPGNSKSDHDLSIVIPAYNEEKRIIPTLDSILSYFKESSLQFEIIIVDDGSTDQTVLVATDKLKFTPHMVLQNGVNRGKGFSVRKGALKSRGEIILFTDSDLSTPIEDFEKLKSALDDGYDIAIGSRGMPSTSIEKHQGLLRESMGKIFHYFARCLTFTEIRDSQCGFKAFKRQPGLTIFKSQKVNGFCFDAELLFLAQKMGYRIKEVGVRWKNSPQSRVKIISDSLSMFFDLFRIRLYHGGKK